MLAGAGYLAWLVFKPNPVGESDMIVRRYSAAIAEQMGPFRRALRDVQRDAGETPELRQQAIARIDELARELNLKIEDLTDEAVSAIEMLDGIGLRTQENRLSRIRRLSLEGRSRVGQVVAETKADLARSTEQ